MPKDIGKPLDVNFGNKVKLLGITIDKAPQNQLKISYYWQLIEDLGVYDVAFVHFTDKDDKVLFQNDHDFCQKRPFNELKGKFIKEVFVVDIPKSAAGNKVDAKIGIYGPTLKDASRLQIKSSGGVPMDGNNTRAIVDKISL
jgi:hypothetical protein